MPYQSLFTLNPGQSRILYLDEIPVVGYTTDHIGKLKDEVYAIMEKKLVEYNAGWRKEQHTDDTDWRDLYGLNKGAVENPISAKQKESVLIRLTRFIRVPLFLINLSIEN